MRSLRSVIDEVSEVGTKGASVYRACIQFKSSSKCLEGAALVGCCSWGADESQGHSQEEATCIVRTGRLSKIMFQVHVGRFVDVRDRTSSEVV